MRIDHAPSISEIQRQFCPTRWIPQTETKYVWVRDRATGLLEMNSYEAETEYHTIIEGKHKVVQSYVLRRLSDYVVRAVAVVSSGGGVKVNVNEWSVLMIDAQTPFAIQLGRSAVSCQVQDENGTLYSVANIGGGHVLTKLEYLKGEQRRSELVESYTQQSLLRAEFMKRENARRQAEEQEKSLVQQEQQQFVAKANYALTGEDIQRMLPVSPAPSYYSCVHTAPDVLQVYVLLSPELEIHICAVISKRCNWLPYNKVGCCDYSFNSGPCNIVGRFTVIHEQSQVGTKLLSKKDMGEVFNFGQKQYLIVNIGGGNFAVYHNDWHSEKQGIEKRMAIKLAREAEKQRREIEGQLDRRENGYL